MAERRREAGDQAGEHAELLSLCVALQGLHPQEEEADALATDLRVDIGAQATVSCLRFCKSIGSRDVNRIILNH